MKALFPLLLALGAPALADPPFRLGVQTHFEQGWPVSLIDKAKSLGATLLRDEVSWDEVEGPDGGYDFTRADLYLARIAAAGMTLQLVTMDAHPAHDGGKTPHSRAGQAAYARYLAALMRHAPETFSTLELGNEVNSGEFTSGPYGDTPARMLAAQARAVKAELAPGQKLVCSGVNTVATGFLRQFFRYGGLLACDGISVHPYREHPETLDLELARLQALMSEMGGAKPLYASEFGKWVEDAEEAGPWMLKMVSVMAAAGVREAIWYALVDEPYWPNMGLLAPDGGEKPAAATFRLLQRQLLPLGAVTDLSPSRRSRHYAYGAGGHVLWGSGAELSIEGAAEILSASGDKIAAPDRLSDQPIIVLGEGAMISITETPARHDSLYEYGTPPWSYYALRPGIGLTPLEVIDDRWGSYRSAPDLAPLRVTDTWLTTARFSEGPFHVVEAFTAPADGRYQISGRWRRSAEEEEAKLTIVTGGSVFAETKISPEGTELGPIDVTLAPGETLQFDIEPWGPTGVSSVTRRIRVTGPLPEDAAKPD